jgi:hypothetical protein
MEEIWKEVLGYEGLYEVSNLGRVRSVDRYVRSGGLYSDEFDKSLKKGKMLNCSPTKRGYTRVSLSKESKTQQIMIHRLVAIAFLDPVDGKLNVNHINGIKTDNRVSNLEFVNQRENVLHAKIYTMGKDCPFVSYLKKYDRYESSIIINGKAKKLGRFKTEEEAYNSYVKALEENGLENKYINHR